MPKGASDSSTNAGASRVQTVSATGSTDSQRVRTNLTLTVTRTQFSAASAASNATTAANTSGQGQGAILQVTGKVSEENAYVKMGAFHTLDLEMNRDVKIIKGMWDAIALQRVDEACVEGRGAEVGAIVCGEGGPGLPSA